ncbi:ABC transporter substrate-binding protein [Vallitalea longa]|uniref:ABC transporter substrate-binding protein n=1 Tax=Vallitalea longa TaxID=2936439 RepID=A0A9W6DEW7_9FIRM|nr:ABC transporter substrate-binding protein [Vallitalea longa]GKX29955.1 ABC transporter substrate-binding protein [Vallitalea longa]
MKKIMTLLLILVLCFSITGCGDKTEDKSTSKVDEVTKKTDNNNVDNKKTVELNFWHLWTGSEAEALQAVVDDFNESQTDIHVTLLSTDIQKQLAALSTGSGPDIAGNFYFNVASWAQKGAMMDLSELIERDKYDINDFVPSTVKTVTLNDRLYALPIAMHVNMLYYNKDMLEAAGYDKFPEKISEFKQMINDLSVVEDGNIKQLGYMPSADPGIFNIASMYGAKFVSDDGKEILEDEALINAYKFEKEFTDNYSYESIAKYGSSFGKYMSPDNPFFTGNVAVKFDGEWLVSIIDEFAKDLNYSIAPLPYPDDKPELKNAGYASPSIMYIPQSTKHPEEAWTFLKYLVSEEAMVKFTAKIGNLPARKSCMDNKAYDHINGFKVFLDYAQGDNICSIAPMNPEAEYVSELIAQYDMIMNNKISAEEAIEKIKKKLDPKM